MVIRSDKVNWLIAQTNPLLLASSTSASRPSPVLARNRIFWRLTLPPALLILSPTHFLPETSHNVLSYLASLENPLFPTLVEKHEIAKAHSAMT